MLGSYAWRSEDHARPPCQSHVGVVLQAPADRAVAFALLTLFQLLQQTKIARNFNWKEEKWEETERFCRWEAATPGKEDNPKAAARACCTFACRASNTGAEAALHARGKNDSADCCATWAPLPGKHLRRRRRKHRLRSGADGATADRVVTATGEGGGAALNGPKRLTAYGCSSGGTPGGSETAALRPAPGRTRKWGCGIEFVHVHLHSRAAGAVKSHDSQFIPQPATRGRNSFLLPPS